MAFTLKHLCFIIAVFFCFLLPAHSSSPLPEYTEYEKQWIKDHPLIRVRIGQAPPLHFYKKDRSQGISVDYLDLIAHRAGLQIEYVKGIPWPQALEDIKTGRKTDLILTIKRTREREKFISFTDEYLFMPWVIFVRNDAQFLSGIVDLQGRTVSVENGYVMHKKLKNQFPLINLLVTQTSEEAVEALATGKADAHIGNLTTVSYIIQQNNFNNIKVAAPTPFEAHNQAMGIRKDWHPLAVIINKALKTMTPQDHAAIRNHWLSLRYEYGISRLDILKWVSGMALVFGLIMGIILIWNRKLKKEILKRQKSEQDLAGQKALFQNVFHSQPDAIFILDPKAPPLVKACNSAALEIFGYSEEELLGDTVAKLHISPSHLQKFQDEIYSETSKFGMVKNLRFEMKRKDKAVFPTEHVVLEMTDGKKVRTGWISIVRDLTEQKKLEIRLQQAQKMEAIGTLSGGIAHDFNNILFPLVGFAEMLKEDLPLNSPLQDNVSEVLQAALRASDLVKQILAFSRQSDQKLRHIRLQPIIREALKLLSASIPKTIDIQERIDQSCGKVMADPTQIHQIIMNLSTNAFHAMQGSSGRLTLSLEQACLPQVPMETGQLPPGEYALLKVSDTGVGIEKEVLKNIFDPYFTTKERGKGTGLGLSVVLGIVKTMKGDIRAESRTGKGSTFSVYLPVVKETGDINPERQNGFLDKEITGGMERILLVDDEKAIIKMERLMLERLGYRVTAIQGSHPALAAFRANPGEFDLVITDYTMPRMAGLELIKKIRTLKQDIPVILCTGFSDEVNEQTCKAFNIQGLVMKPVSKSDLAEAIRKVFDDS